MKVLLLADVKDLGKAGEIKDVSDGFGRNFLIPRRLATTATPENVRQAQIDREAKAKRDAKVAKETQTLAQRINGVEVHFKAHVGEQDRLYGSITNVDIAKEVSRSIGQEIDRHNVELEEPIRALGAFQVPVRVGRGAVATVTVIVERD
ncbi:MAG: 50S ribosomal protein L9 [Chloroflexota bacterium]